MIMVYGMTITTFIDFLAWSTLLTIGIYNLALMIIMYIKGKIKRHKTYLNLQEARRIHLDEALNNAIIGKKYFIIYNNMNTLQKLTIGATILLPNCEYETSIYVRKRQEDEGQEEYEYKRIPASEAYKRIREDFICPYSMFSDALEIGCPVITEERKDK